MAKTYGTYFETQNQTLNELYRFINDEGYTFEPLDCFQVEHINYDTYRTYHVSLITKNGNPARKMAHATISRLSSGRYELIMYLN
jgi:hypothetical protein